MYERAKAEPETIDPPYNYTYPANDPPSIDMTFVQDPNGNAPDYSTASWAESKQYIIFVHGWNQDYYHSTNFAETMFKRLWHRGYKGRYAAFRWPTYYAGSWDPTGFITGRYNDSEYIAWKAGQALVAYINYLLSAYVRDVAAHSLGNVVVGSALQQGLAINNYALLHAAVPAYCYDTTTADLDQFNYPTPDYDTDQATSGLAYRGELSSVPANLINFYDARDAALDGWRYNNQIYRPQISSSYFSGYYYYHPDDPATEKLGIVFQASVGRFVRTQHEAMAYVDASRTLTVGAEGRTAGSVSSDIDTDANYGFGLDNSAEWNKGIQTLTPFYNQLLDEFNLPYNP